jgi:hypothetical protein
VQKEKGSKIAVHFGRSAVKKIVHMPLVVVINIVVRVSESAPFFSAHVAQQCVESRSCDVRVKGHRVIESGMAMAKYLSCSRKIEQSNIVIGM